MKLETAILQKEFKTEGEKLLLNLLYTASWLNVRQTRFFKPFGISQQQYNVLRILKGQSSKGITVLEIQDRMLEKTSNTSRLIDKLLEKKLVSRKQNKEDRRRVEVKLTNDGLLLLNEIEPFLVKEIDIFNTLTVNEQKTVNTLLDKLKEINQ